MCQLKKWIETVQIVETARRDVSRKDSEEMELGVRAHLQ